VGTGLYARISSAHRSVRTSPGSRGLRIEYRNEPQTSTLELAGCQFMHSRLTGWPNVAKISKFAWAKLQRGEIQIKFLEAASRHI
jgi:hypothetical protein